MGMTTWLGENAPKFTGVTCDGLAATQAGRLMIEDFRQRNSPIKEGIYNITLMTTLECHGDVVTFGKAYSNVNWIALNATNRQIFSLNERIGRELDTLFAQDYADELELVQLRAKRNSKKKKQSDDDIDE